MRALEQIGDEFRVLRQLVRGMPRQGSHRERLDGFYGGQAEAYDRFRERLLAGRAELVASIDLQPGEHLVELGAGTGRNLGFFSDAQRASGRFTLVDLCTPLLQQARARWSAHAQVEVVCADAAEYRPVRPVQAVMLSYALTMMPAWRAVLANAQRMLAPGGRIAVVDFYVSAASPIPGLRRHPAWQRHFWPRWFAHDGVQLDAHRLDDLCARFPRHSLVEDRHAVPYLPWLNVPHYRFVGQGG